MKVLALLYSRDWRHGVMLVGAAVFPPLIALLLTGFIPVRQVTPPLVLDKAVPPVSMEDSISARDLNVHFERIGYVWPLQGEVPMLIVSRIPADMGSLSVKTKKTLFFRALLPIVMTENERIRSTRRWLEALMHNGDFSNKTHQRPLRSLLKAYGLNADAEVDISLLDKLRRRIDVIPPGLVLAQAANESGWGTSRFSRKANNLFGEWTYRAKEGILPLQRRAGARHYVRRFKNIRESVRAYLNNLNRHRAYKRLRRLRAEQRRQGLEPDALTLAEGLLRYSERGKAYVADIRSLIRSNGLNVLGPLRPVRSATAE